jgi:hypothetical protein
MQGGNQKLPRESATEAVNARYWGARRAFFGEYRLPQKPAKGMFAKSDSPKGARVNSLLF